MIIFLQLTEQREGAYTKTPLKKGIFLPSFFYSLIKVIKVIELKIRCLTASFPTVRKEADVRKKARANKIPRKKVAHLRRLVKRSKKRTSFSRTASTLSSSDISIPEVTASAKETTLTDLPFSYGETKLVLMVRDPYWAYSYWDFSGETWNWIQSLLTRDSSLKPTIRIHDLDTQRFFHLLVSLAAKNWYLHLGVPDHRYVAELGLGDGNSKFYLIACSNEVRTPRDRPSDAIDPEWNDQDFAEIYRLSGGGDVGLSSPGSHFIPRQA